MAGLCAERGRPAGVLTVRKEGKLPSPAARVEYSLEYGTAAIEAPDVLTPEDRVLIVDDVLATGGTIAACRQLIAELGAQSIGVGVVMQVDALRGHEIAKRRAHTFSLLTLARNVASDLALSRSRPSAYSGQALPPGSGEVRCPSGRRCDTRNVV